MLTEGSIESNGITTVKRRYYKLGVSYIVIGAVFLAVTLFADISDKLFLGLLFLILGVCVSFNAFDGFRNGESPWHQTMIAVTTWIAGIVFLLHPLAKVILFSFFISIYFFVDGLMRMLEFVRIRTMKGAYLILFSAVLEIICGVASWGGPYSDMPTVRLMFTIYLVIAGVLLVVTSKH